MAHTPIKLIINKPAPTIPKVVLNVQKTSAPLHALPKRTQYKFESKWRSFTFTANNYTDDIVAYIKNFGETKCDYMIFGYEVGEQGTPHLQGYMRFPYTVTFGSLLKHTVNKESIWWVEPVDTKVAGHNDFAAENYCKKDGKVWSCGTPPKRKQPGKRNDLIDIRERILKGDNIRAILADDLISNNQQLVFAEKLQKYVQPKRRFEKPNVEWYYGKSGSGKSNFVNGLYPNAWKSNKLLNWFDGYDGHEDVIFEEFRANKVQFSYLLELTDRYAMRTEVKNAFTNWDPKNIIFTSTHSPMACWADGVSTVNGEDKVQLYRRLDKVVECIIHNGEFYQIDQTNFYKNIVKEFYSTKPPLGDITGDNITPLPEGAVKVDLNSPKVLSVKSPTDLLGSAI